MSIEQDVGEPAPAQSPPAAAPDPGTPAGRAQPLRPDAFISYSRKDAVVVGRLVEALEARGKDVWIDREDIRKSADWRARITAGIASAKCVIVVLSPDFARSEVAREEVARAVEQHKRLVPVVCSDLDPSTLPDAVRAPNWIFWVDEVGFGPAVDEIQEAIELDLDWLDAHARLLVRATEWNTGARDTSVLLRRRDLAAAEAWLAEGSAHAERPTDLQIEYVLASRRAEARRRRITSAAILTALAVSLGLALLAWLKSAEAVHQSELSLSRELATTSSSQLHIDPELSLLLAVRAEREERTPEALAAIRQALAASRVRRRLRAPGGPVSRVAVAPGPPGLLVASAGARTTTSNAAGRFVRALPGGRARLDATGRRLVTLDRDGRRARVFDTGSGRVVADLAWPGATFDDVALAGSGAWAVANYSTDGGNGVRVWRLGSSQSFTLPGAWMVAASATRSLLAVIVDGRLLVQRLGSRGIRRFASFDAPGEGSAAAFDGAGTRLAVVAEDGLLTIRDLRSGTARSAWPVDRHSLLPGSEVSLAFDPSGRRVAVAVRQNFAESGGGIAVVGITTASVWDSASATRLSTLRGHAGLINAIAFSPDGERVVTASDDGTARVWPAGGGVALHVLRGHDGAVLTGAFAGNDRVVTGGTDGTTRVWDVRALRPLAKIGGETFGVSPRGGFVAATGEDGSTALWDVLTRTRVTAWSRPAGDAQSIAVDDRGATVAVEAPYLRTRFWSGAMHPSAGSAKGTLLALSRDGRRALVDRVGRGELWDARTPGASVPLRWGAAATYGAVFSPDGTRVVTLGGDVSTTAGDAPPRIWDTRTGHLVKTLGRDPRVYVAAFSPDGRRVATGGEDGMIRIWDARSGRPGPTLNPRAGRVLSVAFDASGRSLVAAVRDIRAFVWDLSARGTPVVLSGHDTGVLHAAFSPDGTLVVTSAEGAAALWERSTGRLLLRVPGQATYAPPARLSVDGQSFIVIGERAGVVAARIFPCDVCGSPAELVDRARSRLTRPLTPSERRTYVHER